MKNDGKQTDLFAYETLGLASSRIVDRLRAKPWQADTRSDDDVQLAKQEDRETGEPKGHSKRDGDTKDGKPIRPRHDAVGRTNTDQEPLPYVVCLQRGMSAREREMRALFGKPPHPDKARMRRRKD